MTESVLSVAERDVLLELAHGLNATCAKIGDAIYGTRRPLHGSAPHARTVGCLIRSLRSRGYVVMAADSGGKRGIRYELTAAGRAAIGEER